MRKLMINSKANTLSPVMNGLVCWLDARDGKNGDTIWNDRSYNGNDFNLNGFSINNLDSWDKGLLSKILTGSSFYCESTKYDIIDFSNDFVIDILCSSNLDSSTFKTIFSCSAYLRLEGTIIGVQDTISNLKLWINGTDNNIRTIYSYENNKLNNLLFCYNKTKSEFKFYLNGYYINKVVANFKSTVNLKSLLFSRNGNNGTTGINDKFPSLRMGSFKIYNRALTDLEILQNYNYEKSITRG